MTKNLGRRLTPFFRSTARLRLALSLAASDALEKPKPRSNEHQLVIDTLTPIDPERRAFHLVNGVLIQKSAGVVLPEVQGRKASIEALIEQLKGFLVQKEKDSREWKEKYNIRTQQEHEAMQKAREAEAKKAGRAAGDGASPSGLLA